MTGVRRAHRAQLVSVAMTLLLVVGTTVFRTYVHPDVDERLQRADAIVVLGGNPYERFEHGIALASQGLADEVVLSNSVGPTDERMKDLCNQPVPRVRVTCFLPVPWTTRGEAREIRRIADQRQWRTLIVVTTTAHVERARFIMERCYNDPIQMTDFPERRGVVENVFGWAYQSAGWLKALSQTGC